MSPGAPSGGGCARRGGEELAAWLREEYGAAVRRRGGRPLATLAFGPGGEERGDGAPAVRPRARAGRPAPHTGGGGLPPDLAPLPLLSLLWECGRLTEGQIRIHAT